jgi:catechol 2,3-dioxygenase-like lactoylglutathione lyase family enzyme
LRLGHITFACEDTRAVAEFWAAVLKVTIAGNSPRQESLRGRTALARPAASGAGQCDCETWKQATSYCETAFELPAVVADTPLPAYTTPAVPGPVSLNADPGAPGDWPGSDGAVELRQV